jgi:non-specific serine/threonine protein kinase
LFRRLAVFAGAWTLEAAESVGADDGLAESDVLDVLCHLVEKSLVESDPPRERYRLLDTVREYAQIRLSESGEGDRTRSRHLAHYLATAEKARPGLAGPEQGVWLARLDLERENLLAAHAWCDRVEDGAALGLRLSFAVKPYWFFRGLLALGFRVTIEALARPGAQERNVARSRGLFGAGQFCCFMGRYGEGKEYLEECLTIARELGDKKEVAAALQPLGVVSLGLGDVAGARRYAEEAVALARELGDRRELAGALNGPREIYRADGLFALRSRSTPRCSRSPANWDRESIAIALLNLAMVAIGRGVFDSARRMLVEVLAIVAEIGSKPTGQSVLEVSAGLAAAGGEWADAARFYGAAESLARQTGLQRDPADEAFLAPLIAKARDALGATGFARDEDAGRVLTYDDTMAQARAWLERSA